MDLDSLVQLHARRANDANGYATSTHSGVAAVIQQVARTARRAADAAHTRQGAAELNTFAAQLDALAAPIPPRRLTRAVN